MAAGGSVVNRAASNRRRAGAARLAGMAPLDGASGRSSDDAIAALSSWSPAMACGGTGRSLPPLRWRC